MQMSLYMLFNMFSYFKKSSMKRLIIYPLIIKEHKTVHVTKDQILGQLRSLGS